MSSVDKTPIPTSHEVLSPSTSRSFVEQSLPLQEVPFRRAFQRQVSKVPLSPADSLKIGLVGSVLLAAGIHCLDQDPESILRWASRWQTALVTADMGEWHAAGYAPDLDDLVHRLAFILRRWIRVDKVGLGNTEDARCFWEAPAQNACNEDAGIVNILVDDGIISFEPDPGLYLGTTWAEMKTRHSVPWLEIRRYMAQRHEHEKPRSTSDKMVWAIPLFPFLEDCRRSETHFHFGALHTPTRLAPEKALELFGITLTTQIPDATSPTWAVEAWQESQRSERQPSEKNQWASNSPIYPPRKTSYPTDGSTPTVVNTNLVLPTPPMPGDLRSWINWGEAFELYRQQGGITHPADCVAKNIVLGATWTKCSESVPAYRDFYSSRCLEPKEWLKVFQEVVRVMYKVQLDAEPMGTPGIVPPISQRGRNPFPEFAQELGSYYLISGHSEEEQVKGLIKGLKQHHLPLYHTYFNRHRREKFNFITLVTELSNEFQVMARTHTPSLMNQSSRGEYPSYTPSQRNQSSRGELTRQHPVPERDRNGNNNNNKRSYQDLSPYRAPRPGGPDIRFPSGYPSSSPPVVRSANDSSQGTNSPEPFRKKPKKPMQQKKH